MALLDADRMLALKQRLNTEFARRNGYGNLAGYSKAFTDTVAEGTTVLSSNGVESRLWAAGVGEAALEALAGQGVGSDNIESFITILEGGSEASSGCSGYCTGFCTSSCSGTNRGVTCSDCSGTCYDTCSADCAAGCTDGCRKTCGSGCINTCSGACANSATGG